MAVPSRDVVLYTALQQLKLAKTEEDRIESRDLVKHLIKVDLPCLVKTITVFDLFFTWK